MAQKDFEPNMGVACMPEPQSLQHLGPKSPCELSFKGGYIRDYIDD